jgi:DNA-binding response OmpR family regulator
MVASRQPPSLCEIGTPTGNAASINEMRPPFRSYRDTDDRFTPHIRSRDLSVSCETLDLNQPCRPKLMPVPKRSSKANVSEANAELRDRKRPEVDTERDVIEQRTLLPTQNLGNEVIHKHILVVDDDATILCLIVTVLRRTGYRVESADDGVSGWNALRAKRYDLLITDYSMPNLNGLELLRLVWSSPSRIPAILMSAAMPQDVGEIMELVAPGGALHKPFAISELLFKVGTILDHEQSRSGAATDARCDGLESLSRRERKAIELEIRSRLNSLAGKILKYESSVGHLLGNPAPIIFSVCDKFRSPVQTLTGENGFRSILSRALMLSRSEVAWFGTVIISAKGFFEGLRRAEASLPPPEIIRGETVLIAHLLGLLFTFVGEQITRVLLQDIWPECSLIT